MITTPDHLGGHCNQTKVNLPALDYVKQNFKIKSLIDIGCGPGYNRLICEQKNISWFGIDGDPNVADTVSLVHDFCDGPPEHNEKYDLAWSTEFLEHVEAKYIPNFMPMFKLGKYVLCSAGLPGWPGHHHVNCQEPQYWIDMFAKYGFRYDDAVTQHIRKISVTGTIKEKELDNFINNEEIGKVPKKKNYFSFCSLFFHNNDYNS